MSDLNMIDSSLNFLDDINLVKVLLFGDKKYDFITKQENLQLTIVFLKETERFKEAFF